MNAGPQLLVSLLTAANQRMVVPVYQRPYSWDEEQCHQLWYDILETGRNARGNHFTGSVVMVLGTDFNAAGVNELLIIDGQQRITTLTLLILAIAEYAREHPDKLTHVTYDEIIDSGYLVLKHKKGDDHYRLTLSQGDQKTLKSVVDHLENPDIPIVPEAHRVIDNLENFRLWLNGLENPNLIWDGIQRLEVVTISLAQGRDNPQLIFESMNSTGKDLSTADLVRNFVLMGLPFDAQEELYTHYWRAIEVTLGADSYDRIFDDFLRNWLTVIYAPTSIATQDVYRLFKRHVEKNHYDQPGQMPNLLKEIKRFAEYYACITAGASTDKDVRIRLARIAALDISVVNPLLMSIFDDYDEGSFSHDDLIEMLDIIESYLVRRAVCDVPTNSLRSFFSTLISHLNDIQNSGGDYLQAFKAFLLAEAGTTRRMPTDLEFEQALKARDCYTFRRGFFLLSALENSYHPKDPKDFSTGTYSIEHIMPRNALAHEEWRQMLGPDCERIHEELVNTLGNLTLTAYNSELSDGTFDEKKERIVGGYDKELLVISSSLKDASTWNESSIRERTNLLAKRAIDNWQMPNLDADVIESYKPQKKTPDGSRKVTFRALCMAGRLKPGDKLVALEAGETVEAIITQTFEILLPNGETVESPSRAAIRMKELKTGKRYANNGWRYWHLGENGPLLNEVKNRYLVDSAQENVDPAVLRAAFWDDFFDYCSERDDFTHAFGDQSSRWENRGWYVTFGLGMRGCSATAYQARRDSWVGAALWITDFSIYDRLLAKRDLIESLLSPIGGDVIWNSDNEKSREVLIRIDANLSPEKWPELFTWLADALLALKRTTGLLE